MAGGPPVSPVAELVAAVRTLALRFLMVPQGLDQATPAGITLGRVLAWPDALPLRPGDVAVVVASDDPIATVGAQLRWLVSNEADCPVLVVVAAALDGTVPDLDPLLTEFGMRVDRAAADSDSGVQALLIHRVSTADPSALVSADLRSKAALVGENARLRRALRGAEARAASSQLRVRKLESSGALLLGRAMVDVAKNPKRATRNARRLYGRWRSGRGGSGNVPTTLDAAAAARPMSVEGPDVLLAHRAYPQLPRVLPTIALIGSPSTARLLAPHAEVVELLPHDASAVLERILPDFLLIDTRAGDPGSAWSYIGSPSAPDRDRALLEAQKAATSIGVPVVLWRSSGPEHTAFLEPMARLSDLVLDVRGSAPDRLWSPGVSLAGIATGALPPEQRAGVMISGLIRHGIGGAERLGAVQSVLDSGVEVVVTADAWGVQPAAGQWPAAVEIRTGRWGRSRALRECLAGIRAEAGGLNQGGAGLSRESLQLRAAGVRLLDPVAAGRGAVPDAVSATELADTLRALFAEDAVPVRLADLVSRLGIDSDPLWSRRMSVLAPGLTAAETSSLVDDLLGQRSLPYEVVVPMRALLGEAAHRLKEAGITVISAGVPAADSSALAAAAECDWVVPWTSDNRWAPTHLDDKALQAEIIGRAGEPGSPVLPPGPLVRKRLARGEVNAGSSQGTSHEESQ